MPRPFRPAILLHGALAAAAFIVALASSARWDSPDSRVSGDQAAPATARVAAMPVEGREALEHAQAVYRTLRYGEVEAALRCAGFRDVGPTNGGRPRGARDEEVVPHPAVKHAAQADLPQHGSGAGLCAHLQRAPVHEWYRERFRI